MADVCSVRAPRVGGQDGARTMSARCPKTARWGLVRCELEANHTEPCAVLRVTLEVVDDAAREDRHAGFTQARADMQAKLNSMGRR